MAITQSTRLTAGKTAIAVFLAYVLIHTLVCLGLVSVSLLWGGSFQKLSAELTMASLGAIALLLLFCYVVYQRLHINVQDQPQSQSLYSKFIRFMTWLIFAYMCLNTVGNLLSTNIFEKIVSSILTALAALSLFLVASAPDAVIDDDGAATTAQATSTKVASSSQYQSIP